MINISLNLNEIIYLEYLTLGGHVILLVFFSFHQAYFLSKDKILVNYKDTYFRNKVQD